MPELFGEIGCLNCKPIKIELKPDAQPYSLATPRRVPFPLMQKVDEELQRMQSMQIIREVTQPTDWCAPMVPVVKKNGKVRICVDLKRLNKGVKREKFILPTLEDVAVKLTGAKVFSTLDASSGFWQIPLDYSSSILTTFITPRGRFCFQRLPFGITSAPEIFQREMTKLLEGHEGCVVVMDDVLVYGRDQETHDRNLEAILQTIQESGLKLNKEKCHFSKKELVFFGHIISGDGVKPDPDKVKAITDLPCPKDITQLRQVLGMVNYLGKFLPDLSTVLHPLNELLKKDSAWLWDTQQQQAFNNIKTMLSSAPVLAFYDVTKPTIVSADASSFGLGATLLQTHDDKLLPVAFCSRTLSSAELKYSQIEKECLAAVWACERLACYLLGLAEFTLQTDHKPLVPLINTYDLDKTPLRCQRLLMRLMRFNVKAVHVPGKSLVVADALSRNPLTGTGVSDTEVAVRAYVEAVIQAKPISEAKLDAIREATSTDPMMREVMRFVNDGWPHHVPSELKAYHAERASLSRADGLLLHGDRIVIPTAQRREILVRLHEGHLGLNKCRERAKMSVWWPGIGKDLQTKISQCAFCHEHRPTQRKEPLITTPLPPSPWHTIGADLCEYGGKNYLVVVDYYSRDIEIAHLSLTSSRSVITTLKGMFIRWGIPRELHSDNGTQFSSMDFADFCTSWGIQHVTSSPHFPQSNGTVERAVKTAKHILRQPDPQLALLSYRATPITATGASPAQLMLGRQIRTTLPVLEKTLRPRHISFEQVLQKDKKAKAAYKHFFDKRHSVRTLPCLNPGDQVLLKLDGEKAWCTSGTVVRNTKEPRSYLVQTQSGAVFRRNRRHLQLVEHTETDFGKTDVDSSTHIPPAQNTQVHSAPVMDAEQIPPDSVPGSKMTSSGRVIKLPVRYRD